MLDAVKKHLHAGRAREALALLECATTTDQAYVHTLRGAALQQLGETDRAIAAFEQAITIDQTLIAPHHNLALLYHRKKDPRAMRALLLSSWLDPQNPQPITRLLQDAPARFAYRPADIVLYTGTPWLGVDVNPTALDGALGGSETALIMMARGLQQRGYRVQCFCNTKTRRVYDDDVEYIPVEEFFVYAAQHVIPMLIASRFAHPFGRGVRAKRKMLWFHETRGCAQQEPLGRTAEEIDGYLGLSAYQIDTIATLHGLPRDKFFKTRNGFMPELFAATDQPREPHSLIYISRPERGLREALQAFQQIRAHVTDAQLHICNYTQWNSIADDPYLAPLLPLLQQAGVIYHGALSKRALAARLQQSSLMLYPNISESETSCIAAIEAMAAGVPVITSDRGALPETVADGIGGRILPYHASDAFIDRLAHTVIDLWRHPTQWQQLSASARNRAWTHYTWSHVAAEWDRYFTTPGRPSKENPFTILP